MRPTRKSNRRKKIGFHDNPSPEYLMIQDFGEKGCGIVASENISKDSFVVIYAGKKVDHEPAGDDSYVYEVKQKRRFWIDATVDDGSFGRLINDDHTSPNLKVKLVKVQGESVPAFFAGRDISKGEELAYDYGGGDYPWRRNKTLINQASSTNEVPVENSALITIETAEAVTIKDTSVDDTGSYTVETGNTVADFDVNVKDKPSKPNNLSVSKVMKDSVVLSWQPPSNTGGSDISSYIIEKSDSKRNTWTRVDKVTSLTLTCDVQKLLEGNEYYFRVLAENDIGQGEAVELEAPIIVKSPYDEEPVEKSMLITIETAEAVTIKDTSVDDTGSYTVETGNTVADFDVNVKDKPSKPNNLSVSKVMKDSVVLSWQPPSNTGGSDISSYIIEKSDSKRNTWTRVDKVTSLTLTCDVQKLLEGNEYYFRVLAENDIGQGEAVELEAPIIVKSPYDEEPVEKSMLITIETAEAVTIKDTSVDDTGSYTVETGNTVADFDVNVKDKPSKPNNLSVSKVMKDSVVLSWQPPSNTGGSDISSYIIEKSDSKRNTWTRVDKVTSLTLTCDVQKLLEGNEYYFRVLAENDIGQGEAVELEAPIIVKSPYDVPDSPSNLQVTEVTNNSVTLTWEMPQKDYDPPIISYILEKCQLPSNQWVKVSKKPIHNSMFTVPDLLENTEYKFRVAAKNAAVTGKASEPTSPIMAKDSFDKPSAPGVPNVTDVTNDSATLEWTPPSRDCGSPVFNYFIEYKPQSSHDWLPASKGMKVPTSLYTVPYLVEGEVYEFRVSAENKAGLGNPSSASNKVTIKAPIATGQAGHTDIRNEDLDSSVPLMMKDIKIVVVEQKKDTKVAVSDKTDDAEREIQAGLCGRVFVCSGSYKLKNQLVNLVGICGGEYVPKFQHNTTHVIMQTDKPCCCKRSLKYILGIAHHCWILDHKYIEECLKAGFFLPEEEFEILGDVNFPQGLGASLSRRTERLLMSGVKITFSGESSEFPRDAAESVVRSLGGEVIRNSSCIVSLDESGEPNTVTRDWLFDCLSNFTLLDRDPYYCGNSDRCGSESDISELGEVIDGSESKGNKKTKDTVRSRLYVVGSQKKENGKRLWNKRHVCVYCQKPYAKLARHLEQVHGTEIEVQINKKTKDTVRSRLYVVGSQKKENGKRLWNKRHVCVYCQKPYAKLARHLEQVHGTEIEVQRALAFNKSSIKRKAAWKDIQNKGDYAHNNEVYKKGEGEIIPIKRPRIATEGTNFVYCKECKGSYLKSDLYRHVKTAHPCKKAQNEKRTSHQEESASLLPVSLLAKQDFRQKILDKMANDEASIIARNDDTVVTFGQRKFMKHARNPHQYNYIRQKMRELARFVITARNVDSSVKTLKDCIDPLKFQVCVTAVKTLCGFDESTGLFDIPSLATKIGSSLHKVARKIKLNASVIGDRDLKEKAETFIDQYNEEWDEEVSHAALETREIKRYNKPTAIPLAEDLKSLSVHLKVRASNIMDRSEITQCEWRDLCETTLAQVVLFNKRRAGETERLEVQQYLDGIQHGKTVHTEVLESLSPLEKKLTEVIDRVEVRGKLGRRVAILLPEHIKKQMDVLLKHRSCGNIDIGNQYMFARPGNAETPVRASDVLRKYAIECNAKNRETLTSTGFRKHVATISQMLNLKENELDVLAGFLGHDIRVHREFYRLPNDTVQVAKVSKLLLELERGNISKYRGKSLEEIQFDLDEPLEYEPEDGEEEADETDLNLGTEMEMDAEPSNPGQIIKQPNTEGKAKKLKSVSKRKPWNEEEKNAVRRQLGKFFDLDRLPGKHNILEAQRKEVILQNRPWSQIKFYIKNQKVSYKRNTN